MDLTAGQLVQLREALAWDVSTLASYLGVTKGAVYQWERGASRVGSPRVRQLLADLWDKQYGAPWDRERARRELAGRLGIDAGRAGQLLVEYGRVHGEPWRDVVGRVVDGERYKIMARAARA